MQFSVLDMLGTGCFLQVIVEEKDNGSYNRITSVIALPAGMDAPKTETPLIAFDIDAWDDEVFHFLPGWIQERIKKSTQYQKLHVPTDPVDVDTSGGQQTGAADSGQVQKEENPIGLSPRLQVPLTEAAMWSATARRPSSWNVASRSSESRRGWGLTSLPSADARQP